MTRVLVTGGAGYIGSHACKALAGAGIEPVAYDNLVYGHRRAVRWGPLVVGDVADREALERAMADYRPEAVMHFAAFAYVGESVENPAKYYRNNVAGTLTLLEALRDRGIERIVFSSTCATYGNPQKIPIPEDHPQNPINPYGAGKLMVERMLSDFHDAYGTEYVSLRYFNAAGADPAAEIGESHDPETHLIPLVLDAAAGRRGRIDIFGTDYDTPDGTCIRDYVHVTDLADAHLRALDYLRAGKGSGIFNLGNGAGFSVRQVIDAAERVTGRKIPRREAPRRPGDPPVLVGSAERARKTLGWTPRFADIDTIIETAWKWQMGVQGSRFKVQG
jgi:UDP-arabinose 4-epimerase